MYMQAIKVEIFQSMTAHLFKCNHLLKDNPYTCSFIVIYYDHPPTWLASDDWLACKVLPQLLHPSKPSEPETELISIPPHREVLHRVLGPMGG